eukprot:c13523_g1_i1 orf=1312-3105(-)
MAMVSPDFASSDNTMDALRDFLQNMKRTIERLYVGHTVAARQTLKQGNSDNAQSSYDFGMIPTQSKGFRQPPQSVLPDSVGKPGQMQNWFFPQGANPLQERLPGSKPVVATGKTNLNGCSSEVDIGNALSIFLEDMKKTIEGWSSRYHLLVEGKTPLTREGLDVEALPQPLDSNVHVIDQLDFEPDTDMEVMEVLDIPNAETLQGSAQSRNGKLQRSQGNQGRKVRKVHFQGHQSRTDATSFSLQDFNEVMESQVNIHDQESRPQGLVISQECAENDCHMGQPGYNSADHGNMGMDEASRHDRQGADNSIVLRTENAVVKAGQRKRKSRKKAPTTPVNSQELTIRRFQYKVEVVESPDWLPKGWITELKTRSTGGSAGSKDKYYYDPVSNRRCRSQKEVFSLLETGKLGRYKRKTNVQRGKKSSGAETSLVNKTDDIDETQNLNKLVDRPSVPPHQIAHENTAGSASAPQAAISPGAGQMGGVSNMFLPYRPGQPSDWLVYESLANLPRPVLENLRFADPNSSKSNGERGSTPWPWFLNNSESSMRPFVDRFEMGKAAVMGGREDMLNNGQFPAREPRFTEVVAKRARKPSKRAAAS